MWEPLPALPFPYNGSLLAVLGTFLYSFGGLDPYTPRITRSVNRLNMIEGETWQTRSSMIHCRTDQGLLTNNGKFYVFRGYTSTLSPRIKRVLNSVECYCPSLNEWHTMPPMLQPRKKNRGVVGDRKSVG